MPTLSVRVGSHIEVPKPPGQLALLLKKELTIDNPAYVSARKHGRSPRGIPRYIRPYKEKDGNLFLPRGFWDRFVFLARVSGYEVDLSLNTTTLPAEHPPKSLQLWDYQPTWVEALLAHNQGVGVAPPGSGKTCMGLELYARLGQRCLWVTHTKRLARQTARRAEEFLGIRAGVFGMGEADLQHFTVGLVPTLVRRDLKEYQDSFGLIIVDECFPAGTLVDGRPIESLEVGDRVHSFNETTRSLDKRPIVRLFKNRAKSLCGVVLSSGKTLFCTPGHPFWTQRGWVPAGALSTSDEVLDYGKKAGQTAAEDAEGRPQERRVPAWVRVDHVEVLQPGSDGTFGGLCPNGYVYNVEVEHNHTYLADDVVVHNCHHVPAKTFLTVASNFSAHYRYGLTATPYRDDQLEDLIFHVLGPQTAHLDKQVLRDAGHLITPSVIQRETKFFFPFNSMSRKYGYAQLQEALAKDRTRNLLISSDVMVEATREDNVCIVLVGRIDHGKELFNILNPVLPGVGLVHSKMPTKKSDEVLDDFEAGRLRVLVATYRMLAEGFDYRPSNRLFLTAPYKGRTLIEQACGRIERTFPGKTGALVFDYVDSNVGVLGNQALLREEIYEANGLPLITLD